MHVCCKHPTIRPWLPVPSIVSRLVPGGKAGLLGTAGSNGVLLCTRRRRASMPLQSRAFWETRTSLAYCCSAGGLSCRLRPQRHDPGVLVRCMTSGSSSSSERHKAWRFFDSIGSPKYHVAPMVDQVGRVGRHCCSSQHSSEVPSLFVLPKAWCAPECPSFSFFPTLYARVHRRVRRCPAINMHNSTAAPCALNRSAEAYLPGQLIMQGPLFRCLLRAAVRAGLSGAVSQTRGDSSIHPDAACSTIRRG